MSDTVQPAERNPGGRPRKEIDLLQLEAACQIQCTAEECAALFDCSVDTLDRRLKEEGYAGFAEFYKIHATHGKTSLRRLQWKSAQNGNVAMQIWLGKQMLGQRDKSELTGRDGGPIEHVDLSNLTEQELTAYGRLAAKAAGLDPEAVIGEADE